MSIPKLNLKLEEENELAFKVSIEGSSSDIGSTRPRFRFVVTEHDTEQGMVYPAEQSDDGFIVARLPETATFLEEVNYRGKLEVILGNHYFVPTEVDLQFERPLKVEAVVVTKTKKRTQNLLETNNSQDIEASASVVQVRSKKKTKESQAIPPRSSASRRKTGDKRQWDDLSESEQKRVLHYLAEKKKKALQKKKLIEQKRVAAEERKMKSKLKDLMASSLLGDD